MLVLIILSCSAANTSASDGTTSTGTWYLNFKCPSAKYNYYTND